MTSTADMPLAAIYTQVEQGESSTSVLGLLPDASVEQVKASYHALALKLHPDRCASSDLRTFHTELFQKVQDAYERILADGPGLPEDTAPRVNKQKSETRAVLHARNVDFREVLKAARTLAAATYGPQSPCRRVSKHKKPDRTMRNSQELLEQFASLTIEKDQKEAYGEDAELQESAKSDMSTKERLRLQRETDSEEVAAMRAAQRTARFQEKLRKRMKEAQKGKRKKYIDVDVDEIQIKRLGPRSLEDTDGARGAAWAAKEEEGPPGEIHWAKDLKGKQLLRGGRSGAVRLSIKGTGAERQSIKGTTTGAEKDLAFAKELCRLIETCQYKGPSLGEAQLAMVHEHIEAMDQEPEYDAGQLEYVVKEEYDHVAGRLRWVRQGDGVEVGNWDHCVRVRFLEGW